MTVGGTHPLWGIVDAEQHKFVESPMWATDDPVSQARLHTHFPRY